MADVLFRLLKGQPAGKVALQHRATSEMLDVVVDICSQIRVLREWQYTDEQCAWAQERLGILCGWGRQFPAISDAPLPVLILEQNIIEAPFINSMLFLLISPEFDIIRLGAMLASVGEVNGRDKRMSRTTKRAEDGSYHATSRPGFHKLQSKTEHDEDMGIVTVRMQGEYITS